MSEYITPENVDAILKIAVAVAGIFGLDKLASQIQLGRKIGREMGVLKQQEWDLAHQRLGERIRQTAKRYKPEELTNPATHEAIARDVESQMPDTFKATGKTVASTAALVSGFLSNTK